MATYTPNYNLCKPEGTDDFDAFLSEFGNNMDNIDANLGGGGGSGGHTIIDPLGQDMPQRTGLQFIGANVTDDSVNDKTVVTITGGGGGSVNYSLTEQVIGTWINSKPLYQKTINFGAMPALGSSKTVNHGISDIDEVVSAMFTVKRSGSIQYRTLPNVARSSTQAQTLWYMNTTEIGVISGSSADVTSDFSGYVTIQYTKTTD